MDPIIQIGVVIIIFLGLSIFTHFHSKANDEILRRFHEIDENIKLNQPLNLPNYLPYHNIYGDLKVERRFNKHTLQVRITLEFLDKVEAEIILKVQNDIVKEKTTCIIDSL